VIKTKYWGELLLSEPELYTSGIEQLCLFVLILLLITCLQYCLKCIQVSPVVFAVVFWLILQWKCLGCWFLFMESKWFMIQLKMLWWKTQNKYFWYLIFILLYLIGMETGIWFESESIRIRIDRQNQNRNC